MLPLQEFLINGGDPKDLALRVYRHPSFPLVGYKYTVDSPKKNPITDNARGIVLDSDHQLVMKGFDRFYNYGQHEDFEFDWNNFSCEEKMDGSLIISRIYANQILINTSGSFGLGELPWPIVKGRTFRQLFLEVFPNIGDLADPTLTYIWELMSIENKVVQIHIKPHVKLLSVFNGEIELSLFDRAYWANEFKVGTPEIYNVKSVGEARLLMESKSLVDPTFEGVVYRNGIKRLKDKCDRYISLHQAGTGKISKSRIIQRILEDDLDILYERFPETHVYIDPYLKALDELLDNVNGTWSQVRHIENQKEFALAIKHHRFATILFRMRDWGIGPKEVLLRNIGAAEKLLC